MSVDFEYFNLSEVDPTFRPVEAGMRTLQLTKLTPQKLTLKRGKLVEENGGNPVEAKILKGTFLVTKDETFAGRRIYQDFWLHNTFNQKELRRLADGVGIPQEPGEPIDSWAERMSAAQPEFRTFVKVAEDGKDQEGNPVPKNVIQFNNIQAV